MTTSGLQKSPPIATVTPPLTQAAGTTARARKPRLRSVVAGGHGRRDAIYKRLLAATALSMLSLSLALALVLASEHGLGVRLLWSIPFLAVWLLLFKVYGLYDRDSKRISHTTVDD